MFDRLLFVFRSFLVILSHAVIESACGYRISLRCIEGPSACITYLMACHWLWSYLRAQFLNFGAKCSWLALVLNVIRIRKLINLIVCHQSA